MQATATPIIAENRCPKNTFFGCSKLTYVIIPNGVTEIGKDAFSGCEKLTTVVIPEGVTKIGDAAFDRCFDMRVVIVPKSVKYIGAEAFDMGHRARVEYLGTKADWDAIGKGVYWESPKCVIRCYDGEIE